MQNLIERYQKLYSGVIYDALAIDLKYTRPFVLDRHIARVCGPATPVVGRAFPVRGRPYREGESTTGLERGQALMFDEGSQGDVLVMDTGNDSVVAHFGDMSALLASRAKFAGCVIDGLTRDVDRIQVMGVSVFARGATPQDSLFNWGIDDIKVPVVLPGVTGCVIVDTNDLIFADGDGVVVIPGSMAERVLQKAELRAGNERDMMRAIQAGKSAEEVFKEYGTW